MQYHYAVFPSAAATATTDGKIRPSHRAQFPVSPRSCAIGPRGAGPTRVDSSWSRRRTPAPPSIRRRTPAPRQLELEHELELDGSTSPAAAAEEGDGSHGDSDLGGFRRRPPALAQALLAVRPWPPQATDRETPQAALRQQGQVAGARGAQQPLAVDLALWWKKTTEASSQLPLVVLLCRRPHLPCACSSAGRPLLAPAPLPLRGRGREEELHRLRTEREGLAAGIQLPAVRAQGGAVARPYWPALAAGAPQPRAFSRSSAAEGGARAPRRGGEIARETGKVERDPERRDRERRGREGSRSVVS